MNRTAATLTLLLLVCAAPAHADWMERTEAIMGTRCYVELWADDPVKGNDAIDAVMAELRRQITGPWGVVAFVDSGVLGTHQSFDLSTVSTGVGFGVRYKTPVGPVRLDLAYSINPPSFNGLNGTYQQLLFGGATPTVTSVSHFQFFFSIGQAF